MADLQPTSIVPPSELSSSESAVLDNGADLPRPLDADSLKLALTAAHAADDRKGGDIVILGVGNIAYLAEFFVIVTGFSPAQVKAISRSIEGQILDDCGRLPRHTEGMNDSRWILQDYGDVIVHIFMPQEREFYNLEAFWSHGDRIPFESNPVK
jgi:ribosome-associated protein